MTIGELKDFIAKSGLTDDQGITISMEGTFTAEIELDVSTWQGKEWLDISES